MVMVLWRIAMFAFIIRAIFGSSVIAIETVEARVNTLREKCAEYRRTDPGLCRGGTSVSTADWLCKDALASLALGRTGDAESLLNDAESHLRSAKWEFFEAKLEAEDQDECANLARYGKDATNKFGRRSFGAKLQEMAATLDECRKRLGKVEGAEVFLCHAFLSLLSARGLYHDALYQLQEGKVRWARSLADDCTRHINDFEFLMVRAAIEN
jgi:hypothetical protein